jgi:hypothetical protein
MIKGKRARASQKTQKANDSDMVRGGVRKARFVRLCSMNSTGTPHEAIDEMA